MAEKQNTPEIRFEGFADPWEQRKLGDVATRHDNLRIPIAAKDRIPGDTPYYGANGIQGYVEGYTHEGEFVLVAEDGATDLDNYPVQLISGLSWVNNHAHVIKAIPDVAQNRFIMHLIKSMDIASYLVGGTRAKLNAEVLMEIEIKLPSISEQIHIGAILSTLDSLITLHQRKYDKLCTVKKSMLGKMFPKPGEPEPEIRFEGFTDPWEQRKLGEFGSVAMCKRIYKEQTSEQGDVPFFKIGTFGADPDAFISNELFEDFKRTYPYPTPGTLLISAAGSIGRVVEYQGEKAYFQDSNIVWLEHDHRLNDAFLKPLYSQIEWGLEGSTIKRLYNKDLLSAEVTIPDGGEQKEIGQFFARLDSLITLHQRKLGLLRNIKKSLLDRMFV